MGKYNIILIKAIIGAGIKVASIVCAEKRGRTRKLMLTLYPALLLMRLERALRRYEHEIIIVDDNSPDGTAEVAERLTERYPIKVIGRLGVRGLGSAIVHGFRNSQGDVIGVIDADLQHPPEIT